MKTRVCFLGVLLAAAVSFADYTVNIPPGFSAIANHLNNGANSLDTVLPNIPDGSTLMKWDCHSASWVVYSYDGFSGQWIPPGGTLAPGEGAVINNAGSTVPVTFTGTPQVPILPAPLPCGCGYLHLLSCQSESVGTWLNIVGSPPADGALFMRWDNLTAAFVTNQFTNCTWTLGCPAANIGEAVMVYVPCSTNTCPCFVVECPTNKTVECGTPWNFDPPTVITNSCPTNLTVSVLSTSTNTGPCLQTITRIWLISDQCTYSATCTQVVSVVDTTPPDVTCPPDKTVMWGTTWDFDTPTAADDCCTNVSITIFSTHTNGVCPLSITRRWQVTGCCTNDTAFCSQTVTVETPDCQVFNTGMSGPDGNVPLAPGDPDPNYILTFSMPGAGTTAVVAGPMPATWIPNSSSSQWISPDVDSSTTPEGLYRYELRFIVCCTNDVRMTGRMAADDEALVYLNGNLVASVTDSSTWTPVTISGGFNIGLNVLDIVVTNANTVPSWTGLRAELTNCVNELVVICPPDKTVPCDTNWNFDLPTPTSCCTNVVITPLTTVTNGPCPQEVTQTWMITDDCGNTNFCSQTVTLLDFSPPIIACADEKFVECGSAWSFDPPHVFDVCCGTNVTVALVSSNIVFTSPCLTIWEGRWQATDCCSNSIICAQIVTVVDTTPPEVDCPTNKTVIAGTVWDFDPPTAVDACCSNVFITIVGTQTNGPCPLTITRSWEVRDCCSNSVVCIQTVTVETPDCQVFNTGMSGVNGNVPLAPGDPDPNYKLIWSMPGSGTIAVVAGVLDSAWIPNSAQSQWIAPDFDPSFEPPGFWIYRLEFVVCCTNNTQLVGRMASDDEAVVSLNGDFKAFVTGSSTWTPINITSGFVVGLNVVEFWVTNSNVPILGAPTGMRAELTNCAPLDLIVSCPTNKTVLCDTNWSFDLPTAITCCSNLLITPLTPVTNGSCPREITQTWVITDDCGNTNVCSQTVTVLDLSPPIIVCVGDKTVQCGTSWSFDTPFASDTCCTNVIVTILNTETNGLCPQLITRTWQAEDCCGNTATCVQIVTVLPGPSLYIPITITSIFVDPLGVHMFFPTQLCHTYAIERKADLFSPWVVIGTVEGDGTTKEFIDLAPLPFSGFYRIVQICP